MKIIRLGISVLVLLVFLVPVLSSALGQYDCCADDGCLESLNCQCPCRFVAVPPVGNGKTPVLTISLSAFDDHIFDIPSPTLAGIYRPPRLSA